MRPKVCDKHSQQRVDLSGLAGRQQVCGSCVLPHPQVADSYDWKGWKARIGNIQQHGTA
jgi:hypothetical protein